MFGVFVETMIELVLSQLGLFDIYCDLIFISICYKEQLNTYLIGSVICLVFIMIPKLVANILALLIMFGVIKEENKKRKHAYRILIYNEFRMQALNVEYVQH